MYTRYAHIHGLTAPFLFTLLMGAGCAMQLDSGEANREPLGSTVPPEVFTPASNGDSRLDSSCTIDGNFTIRNTSWPSGEPGPCPSSDEYTLDDAVASCDAPVKSYTFNCTESKHNTHTWKAHYQCCAATCSDGIQNQEETGVDCGGPCPACPPPPPCGSQILVDFESLTTGQSVEVPGAVSPYLNISTSTGQAEVIASGTGDIAYVAHQTARVINGCLGNPGGYGADGGSVPRRGFSDIAKGHEYTFTFANGMEVSQFSLLMLDFGDFNPDKDTYHEVDLKAYDSQGAVVDQDKLSYHTGAAQNPWSLRFTGDACTAQPGEPGNFTFNVQGSGIVRVVLSIPEGKDPNIAFDNVAFTPACPPPPPQCGSQVLVDFEPLTTGQSVEVPGAVSPYLNISTSTGQAEVIASGTGDIAYVAHQTARVINGCLGNPGGYGADGGSVPRRGFSDIAKGHEYTFTFANGMEVSQFSLLMLDFGDFNPDKDTYHEVDLKAYDSQGAVVDQDKLSYHTGAAQNPWSLRFTGDACTAQPGEPGNFTFNVQGSGIVKVVLSIPEGKDPNIAFDNVAFTPACPPPPCDSEVIDFGSLTAGDSVEGIGAVNPFLNISTSNGQAEVIASRTGDTAYTAPTRAPIINGCLGNPGGFDADGGSVPGKGFSDSAKNHDYTFTFAPGVEVSQFSLLMLDFGDLNPHGEDEHEVNLTAYDSQGAVVDKDKLSYSSSAGTYGDLLITGDACTAQPGEPGNFKFDLQGSGIVKVVLSIPKGIDPNIGFDNLAFCR